MLVVPLLLSALSTFKPSEPFLTPYLLEFHELSTIDNSIYPVYTYTLLPSSILLQLASTRLPYKSIMLALFAFKIATRVLLLTAPGSLHWMQAMQVAYGVSDLLPITILCYAYRLVDSPNASRSDYNTTTMYVSGVALLSYFFAAMTGQILVSFFRVDLHNLFYLSAGCVGSAALLCIFAETDAVAAPPVADANACEYIEGDEGVGVVVVGGTGDVSRKSTSSSAALSRPPPTTTAHSSSSRIKTLYSRPLLVLSTVVVSSKLAASLIENYGTNYLTTIDDRSVEHLGYVVAFTRAVSGGCTLFATSAPLFLVKAKRAATMFATALVVVATTTFLTSISVNVASFTAPYAATITLSNLLQSIAAAIMSQTLQRADYLLVFSTNNIAVNSITVCVTLLWSLASGSEIALFRIVVVSCACAGVGVCAFGANSTFEDRGGRGEGAEEGAGEGDACGSDYKDTVKLLSPVVDAA
jgi:hypothetical protein